MRVIRKDFQALQTPFAQLVLGKHARHGLPNDLLGLLLEHSFERNLLQTTWVHGVVAVHLLLAFPSCDSDVRGIRNHDVVAGIDGGVVDGFMLAHERDGDRPRKATEHALTRIDVVPNARESQRRLCERIERTFPTRCDMEEEA